MTLVHVHWQSFQPAMRYRVPGFKGWFRSPPRSLFWVDCCRRKRQARNVVLQVYYDLTVARCAPGKGCKS